MDHYNMTEFQISNYATREVSELTASANVGSILVLWYTMLLLGLVVVYSSYCVVKLAGEREGL